MCAAAALALALAGCGTRAPGRGGPPPIVPRRGPLAIDVVYPRDSALVSAPDSNFIFGSVGNGRARLTIDGHPVDVEPNGAFLAWLPVPGSAVDTVAEYRLVASLDGEEARAVRTIRRPGGGPALSDSATIVETSVAPRGAWWVRSGEALEVTAGATPGARVWLRMPNGDSIPLDATDGAGPADPNWIFGTVPRDRAGEPRAGSGVYRGVLHADEPLGRGRLVPSLSPVAVDFSGVPPACAPPPQPIPEDTLLAAVAGNDAPRDVPPVSPGCAILEVAFEGDTARTPLPLDLWIMSERGRGPVVELREEPSAVGRDGFVVGRAEPGATTLWMWNDGVQARVSGRRNGSVRLSLDALTEAWVALDELAPRPNPARVALAEVGTVRLEAAADRIRVNLAVSEPVPYHVQVDGRRLALILYGAYSNTDWLRYGPADRFLRGARWEQPTDDRYVLHLELAGRPWGYRARYHDGGLVLEVRKPPAIDPDRPLAGLRIAVDPGHPPGGATGPTRLYEADANLAVAFRLKRLLEAEGARVVLTRADREAVRLYDRTRLAELLDAHLLVSIHNNALPDGVNPFENHGTSVYYFHPQARDLARALQRGLLESLGLGDLGIGRASLALARPTWIPAALTEGAFMMIPAQEAALREPSYQEAYARGVLSGLREFALGRIE
ncbi:MAG: N-acetylmuramoyl-L-alanine amidase [Gemmatimonadetes bacterium]|uniref:N-acetylmuramoyl-L-alanine amidase n=1 Tax=Candidatus Kutchimonas denitrificans TaxID=3056748 RepID=A0AAE5CBB2_9BACT|nr:N-acetylmuramoyl-L-alanine amidase [Gemmatimonadota bacterium]NIR74343.1 N-acetylmuramoyl-L-alanine amidase [Candidatus Kutchimonas denitrificans]NIS02594.1 N-acetylmuramoyl-L-alanine amidase [Gemmatimonadota bacterium]NIT68469.1 N-acetylmuramoyl-L-alanine amidase [Gemmatimonadota bacterium]NIU51946.1 hypothetical protein [Gemmatimonadota bacterium]